MFLPLSLYEGRGGGVRDFNNKTETFTTKAIGMGEGNRIISNRVDRQHCSGKRLPQSKMLSWMEA